jgi:Bacterial Ig-like domain
MRLRFWRNMLEPGYMPGIGLWLILLVASPVAAFSQTVTVAVSISSDDAEEEKNDETMHLSNNDLELHLSEAGKVQYIGLRFQSITISTGATISSAYIQFHVDEVFADDALTVTFTGQNIDDAPTFTGSDRNLSNRTETTASVDWAVPHWVAVDDEGAAQLSADISSIVQEIVDRTGWVSGNDIVILIKTKSGSGKRTAESFDGEAASAPEISIVYSPDTTPPAAPVITQPTSPTSDNTPFISGTASEDGGTITLTSDIEGVLAPTSTVIGGTWSIALTTALSIGSHSLTATHSDAASNVSPSSGAKSIEIVAAATDDFQSVVSGNWGKDSNWERWNGSAWVTAPNDPTSSDGKIIVRGGDTITVNVNRTIDEMVIEAGAIVVVGSGALTTSDGSGTDLTVSGYLDVSSSNVNVASSSSAVFDSGSVVDIDGGQFKCKDTATCTFESGAVVNSVSSKLKVEQNATASFEAGSTLNNNNEIELKDSGILQISGTVVNTALLDFQGSSTQLQMQSGGVWEHAKDGSVLPDLSETTWNANSTLLVTGVTTNLPTNFTDSYGHITWSAAGQTSPLNLAASPTAIAGDLTIQSTGASTLTWGSGDDLALGGNYVQSGGSFFFSDAGGLLSTTDVSLTGGTLTLTTGSIAPTLSLTGDLTLSGAGTITESGTAIPSISFAGTGLQLLNAASGITGSIDIVVQGTGGVQLQTDLAAPRNLESNGGTVDANGQDIYVGGNLTVTTDLTNPETITFDGAATQNFTYAPGTFSLPTLIVDNASGSLVMGTDMTITSTASVRTGTLDINAMTVVFGTGTTLYNAGTVSGSVTFERLYSLVQNGWRMLATPVDGINYSALNVPFHTQGATWADFSEGTANLQAADFAAQDWTPLTGADGAFTASDGYIFYMYAAAAGDPELPDTWSVTGTVRSSSPRALPWNTVSTDSYSLAGNRTTSNVDWDTAVAASTNVAPTYATWDPALSSGGGLTGYKYYNSASKIGDAGRYIPPFTAFMVEPTASGGSLEYSTSEAANLESANYFGKGTSMSRHIRLVVEGREQAEVETYLVFDPDARRGKDDFDANRMRPLSEDYVTLMSLEGDRRLAMDGRSMAEGVQRFTVALAASEEGTYELSWPTLYDIPGHWQMMLVDERDGRTLDLRTRESIRFEVTREDLMSAAEFGRWQPEPRFTVVVVNSDLSDMPNLNRVVDELVIAQNFPNPFNPVTTIRFSVPETSPVKLEVFDLLGRRIALLADGVRERGWHEVRWDAAKRPSGQYFYRLIVGQTALTRPMLFIR